LLSGMEAVRLSQNCFHSNGELFWDFRSLFLYDSDVFMFDERFSKLTRFSINQLRVNVRNGFLESIVYLNTVKNITRQKYCLETGEAQTGFIHINFLRTRR